MTLPDQAQALTGPSNGVTLLVALLVPTQRTPLHESYEPPTFWCHPISSHFYFWSWRLDFNMTLFPFANRSKGENTVQRNSKT